MEIDLAVSWIEADESTPGKEKAPRPPVECREGGRGVAGQFIGTGVFDLTGPFVEGDHATAVAPHLVELPRCEFLRLRAAATDLSDQKIARDYRCCPDTEKILHHTELLTCVDLPDQLPIRDPQAMQHSLCAIDVDAITIDEGAAPRAIIVAVEIFVIGLVAKGPKQCPRFAMKTDQLCLIGLPVKV